MPDPTMPCRLCPVGTFSNVNTDGCEQCKPGRVDSDLTTPCKQCSAGQVLQITVVGLSRWARRS